MVYSWISKVKDHYAQGANPNANDGETVTWGRHTLPVFVETSSSMVPYHQKG
jgi:hypothetical protein